MKNTPTTSRSPTYSIKIRILEHRLSETIPRILSLRDPDLLGHSFRVASFATRLARRLACPAEQEDLIWRGSLLHDVGKLGISQTILSQPAVLTMEEYETVKAHPVLGAAMLQESQEHHAVIPIVLHHHEFFNGRGYPDQIAGEQIAFETRIVAVADAVDVMASDRPYHKACAVRQIIDELESCAGTQFDPTIVEVAIPLLLERKYENSHYSM